MAPARRGIAPLLVGVVWGCEGAASGPPAAQLAGPPAEAVGSEGAGAGAGAGGGTSAGEADGGGDSGGAGEGEGGSEGEGGEGGGDGAGGGGGDGGGENHGEGDGEGGGGLWDLEAIRDGATAAVVAGRVTTGLEGLRLVDTTDLTYTSWEVDAGAVRAIRIEAYVAVPQAAAGVRAPGVVLAHGLGGRADREGAARLAGRLGMAVLAYSGPGQGASEGHGTGDDIGRLWDTIPDPRGSWFWGHAVAAMRALTVLEDMPQVDPARLGMVGGSGGAVATLLANGLDDRIDAAVAVSGTGELGLAAANGGWENDLLAEDGKDRDSPEFLAFLEHLDPIRYAADQRGATLLINGAQDEFFPLDSTDRTFAAMAASARGGDRHRLLLIFNWDHGCFATDLVHLGCYDHSDEAGRMTNDSADAWLLRHLAGERSGDPLPPTPTAELLDVGGVLAAVGRIASPSWRPAGARAHLSVDQAYTFLSVALEDQAAALGPGAWGALLPAAAAQHNDSNTAYFVEFELRPTLTSRLLLTSRPHLPPGFAPRLRPIVRT